MPYWNIEKCRQPIDGCEFKKLDCKYVLAVRTAREYSDSVKVAHKGNTTGARDMRTTLHGFIVTKDTCMAKGIARANPHLGRGGATQYFIENKDKANLKTTNKLIKYGK